VTGLFTEFTGVHDPLPLEWTIKPLPSAYAREQSSELRRDLAEAAFGREGGPETPAELSADVATAADEARTVEPPSPSSFVNVMEFCKALNRLDAKALELAAGPAPEAPIEGAEVRKLVGTFWFGAVFARLSQSWRERLLDALVESLVIPNHVVRHGRQPVTLATATYDELKEIDAKLIVGDPATTDLKLLLAIANLWGPDALKRVRFEPISEPEAPSRLGSLWGLRG
jgi:hypothetical protein